MRSETPAHPESVYHVDLQPHFVGRDADLGQLQHLVEAGDRLVTVSGPPGIGKSRLAHEFVARSLSEFDGNVWNLDLGELRAPRDLVDLMAETLGIPLEGDDGLDRTAHALAGRDAPLLVLDSCEHLIGPELHDILHRWVQNTRDLQILATSRSRLGLSFEQCLTLDPLALDEAVEMFEAQARRLAPDFTVDARNRETVERLVERLDRLPLATKLAAGRIRVLSPEQMVDRLNRRFDLLDASGSDRLRSLKGAITTSWASLSTPERQALAQCSVFRGPFQMEAAESVVELDGDAPPVLEVVSQLVDHSLLQSNRYNQDGGPTTGGPVVLRMLESIRNFAARRLEEHGHPEAVRRRHADYFRDLVRVWDVRYVHPDFLDQIPRLELHLDNLHRAHARAMPDRPAGAAKLCSALADFYNYRRNGTKALELVEETLDRCNLDDVPRLHAKLQSLRATRCHVRDIFDRARDGYRRALELTRDLDVPRFRANTLINLAMTEFTAGHFDEAAPLLERAMAIAEREEFAVEQTVILSIRGRMECEAGQLDAAESSMKRGLDIFQALDAPYQESRLRINYGVLLQRRGQLDEALDEVERAVELTDDAGHPFRATTERANLACALTLARQYDRAAEAYQTALDHLSRRALERAEANTLLDFGLLRLETDDPDSARELLEKGRRLSTASNRIGGFSNLGGVHAALAVVEALDRNFEAADRHLDRTEALLEDAPSEQTAEKLARFVHLQRRHVDLLRWEAAQAGANDDGRMMELRDKLEETRRALDERSATSFEEKLAARTLHRAFETRNWAPDATDDPPPPTDTNDPASEAQPTLVLGPEAHWLEIHGTTDDADTTDDAESGPERHDFSRRGPLRRLVLALADHHERSPGESLSTYDLLEAGWPDQQVDPDSGTNRVYTAVSRLRSLGFDAFLLTDDAGYRLDPSLVVERKE